MAKYHIRNCKYSVFGHFYYYDCLKINDSTNKHGFKNYQ